MNIYIFVYDIVYICTCICKYLHTSATCAQARSQILITICSQLQYCQQGGGSDGRTEGQRDGQLKGYEL